MKCHNCTSDLWSSVIQYVCIAYLPLTVFLCMVVLLRISVTLPSMNVLVFLCKILAQPEISRYILQKAKYSHDIFVIKILATLYGIWNLDFFRSVVPPICLLLNIMQIIALDYLVAVYPLVLLVCFYVLLTAHDRGWRPIVWLWRPFRWCTLCLSCYNRVHCWNPAPLALLLLYPMQWFQRCLNRCRLNCQALYIFMQCFQGYYRDRTDGGRECRYFVAAFKIYTFVLYGLTLGNMFFVVFIGLSIGVVITIIIAQPYKKTFEFYNKLDAVLILILMLITIGFVTETVDFDERQMHSDFGYFISGLFSLTPLLYITITFCVFVKHIFLQVLHYNSWNKVSTGLRRLDHLY